MRHQRCSRLGQRVKSGELKSTTVRRKCGKQRTNGAGHLRTAKAGRCKSSTNGPGFANSILSVLESAPGSKFRGALQSVCMYLSFFVEASGPQRLSERHRERWLRRLVLKTTARRDATSGFAPVESYRATLSSPCSTYIVAWVCCRDSFALLRFHRYLSQLLDILGICSALAFASREWLIESP